MSNSNKSLSDRIAVMQAHCLKNRDELILGFDEEGEWYVLVNQSQVGEASEDFEEALGSAEAELYIDNRETE